MSNIAIRVNDTFLELPIDFVFSQTKKSPLYFGDEVNFLPGSYTLPANIPTSDVNRAALRHRDFIDNTEVFEEELPADIFLFGNFYERGRLVVKSANPSEFRIQFFSGNGELSGLKEKSLRDYDLGEISIQGSSDADMKAQLAAHFQDTQDSPHLYSHLYHQVYLRSETTLEDFDYIYTPQQVVNMYLRDVLQQIIEAEGFNFIGDVFNTYHEGRYLLHFPRIVPVPARSGSPGNLFQLPLNRHVPNISVAAVLSESAKTHCWCYYVNSNRRTLKAFKQTDVLSQAGIERTNRLAGLFTRSENELRVKSLDFRYSGNDYERHEKAVQFAAFNFLGYVESVSDLPDGAEDGDLVFVYQLMSYVVYLSNADDPDTAPLWDVDNAFQNLEKYVVARTGKEIESKCGTTHMNVIDTRDSNTDFAEQTAVAPLIVNRERYTDFAEQVEDFALVCYFGKYLYRGDARPLVSHTRFDTLGNSLGAHSLLWDDRYGVYVRNWKPWIDFLNQSDAGTVDMLWTENDLSDEDIFLKPMILLDAHSGTKQKFLLKEMKISIGMQDGLRVTTQKLVQMRNLEERRGKK